MLTLVSPMTVDLGEIASRLKAHARGLAEAGHPEGSAESIVVAFAHVAPSEDEAREIAAPALGRFIEAMVGVAPADPEDLYQRMRDRDSGLFGTVEHVAKQIERYAQIGAGHMAFVTRFGGMDAAAAERTLCALAPAV
jgi:alkanesulfonate monooxygenase SsuD/methylene tetrahydromethanopterin reductase-like flavin-dependent oxidoreductase (luciferase family)